MCVCGTIFSSPIALPFLNTSLAFTKVLEYRKPLIFRGLYISRINGKHRFRENYFRDMMNGQSGIFLEVPQSVCDAELCHSFDGLNFLSVEKLMYGPRVVLVFMIS